ncbi:translational machinery component [Jackrogersella minutella]|nr:translational machinery component [Jackrogersella minutella]
MSQRSSRLLAATRIHIQSSSSSSQSIRQCIRPFSLTCRQQAEDFRGPSLLDRLGRQPQSQATGPPRRESSMSELQHILTHDIIAKARNIPIDKGTEDEDKEDWGPSTEPFHFHIYAHKHNAHITVTKPNRNAIISMSTGQIGFKKSKRSGYDAAYQLTTYVIDKLHQGNWHKNISTMEVVLRGFGPGREAATKVLLGTEGRYLRNKIVKVSDATRLKFGGTRSPKPRRLG